MKASMRRTATIDYRISRVPVLCKDCRQDVGLYPARHVCNNSKDSPPPLPIVDLRAVATRSANQPQPINTYNDKVSVSTTATETVERAKVVVGRGWEAVRNMNWKDMTKKEPESNSSRIWGRLIQATSTARQKVADKYYEVREGGNESDDDTPDNTHTQRVLAQYYLGTEGALPQWLNPPSSLAALSATSHRPSTSNATSGSGSSTHRGGSTPVSLQDIYDSARPNQQFNPQSRTGRTPDLYASDQSSSGRQALAGDRLRNKLRPSNLRPSNQPGSNGDQDTDDSGSNRGGRGYSGRSGFGGGDEYDPYNYQQPSGYDSNRSRQGQYGGLPNRPGGRR